MRPLSRLLLAARLRVGLPTMLLLSAACSPGIFSDERPDATGAPSDGGAVALDGGAIDDDGDAGSVNADAGVEVDAGELPTDAGEADVDGGALDAGVGPDASVPDAGSFDDAGALDGGNPVTDAGPTDAGPTDAGPTDAGPTDAGPTDAGRPDAGATDAGRVDAGLLNPFYTSPVWRLWTQDQTPVHFSGYNLSDPTLRQGDFWPPDAGIRKFPDVTVNTFPYQFTSITLPALPPNAAGWWDDAYATRDGAHTILGTSWSDTYGNAADLSNQYIRVPFGQCSTTDAQRLGVNFTSESFSYSGHQLIASSYSADYTERYFSFANTVRGTPAYLSYAETIADRGIDSYDALYGHAFNSVGRSGSELGALFKMLLAGGYMPRTTKDLLKRHGAYGLAMISIFRQTLPYVAADGSPLPIGNEMLQRPAYFSNGANTSQEFIPRNAAYHQYDESLHVYRMLNLAKSMTVAPPIAVLKVVDLSVTKAGATIVSHATTDPRIRSANKTLLRLWGNTGETLTLRVDVSGSYDLQGRPLTFDWQQVYPEQHNVTIVQESASIWAITVAHDPALPKGRIPVVVFANNGLAQSNPAFVNFYWAEAGQLEVPLYVVSYAPVSTSEVQKNRRPLLSSSLGGDDFVNVLPGASTTITLTCTDPDGFPTRYYRWLGEAGTLGGSTFTFTAGAADPGKVYPVHVVCSDGTGGYASTLLRLVVTPSDGVLPATWRTTAYGLPEQAGSVTAPATDTFEVVGNGPSITSSDSGRIVFQALTGDVELTAQVIDFSVDGTTANGSARGGVMLREGLGAGARMVFASVQGNKRSSTALTAITSVRDATDSFPTNRNRSVALTTQPNYLKAVRRGALLVGLASTDGVDWEQLWSRTAATPTSSVVAGFAVESNDTRRGDAVIMARGTFKVVAAPTVSVPVAALAGTLSGTSWQPKVTVTLVPAIAGETVRYTLDGSDPTTGSLAYTAPFDVTTVGTTVLRARSFSAAGTSGQLQLPLVVVP